MALSGLLLCLVVCVAAGVTINGTIYADNYFEFYFNGNFIKRDPQFFIPHNAVNVSFQAPTSGTHTFAILAMDYSNDSTGLEYNNRCIGDGGLRAMFSNGVVTNSKWRCKTFHYGPVNWKDCYADSSVTSETCRSSQTELTDCYVRTSEVPQNWTNPEFDDSDWEHAYEWTVDYVGYGVYPANCSDSNVFVSSEIGADGIPYTCPSNLNWGDAQFIWRGDLDLDNRILCRLQYTIEDVQQNEEDV